MALKAVHNDLGFITLRSDDGPIHLDIGDEPIRMPPTNPQEDQEKLAEIVLGPLPSPPLPAGLVIGGYLDKGRHAGGFQIDLAKAIRDAAFSPEVIQAISDAARQAGAAKPFHVDAYLPPHRQVDLDLLSKHVNKLSVQIGMPIGMRIGTRLKD